MLHARAVVENLRCPHIKACRRLGDKDSTISLYIQSEDIKYPMTATGKQGGGRMSLQFKAEQLNSMFDVRVVLSQRKRQTTEAAREVAGVAPGGPTFHVPTLACVLKTFSLLSSRP